MKALDITKKIFLILTGMAFLKIASEAFTDPQIIMDYVNVSLTNIDARNSIRSCYGGVNLFLGLFILYGAFRSQHTAMLIVTLYCGGFLTGRIYGVFADGTPGPFVINWMIIEGLLTIAGLIFLSTEKTGNKSVAVTAG